MPELLSRQIVMLDDQDMRRPPRETKTLARTPGIHLSGLTRHILTASGLMDLEDSWDEYIGNENEQELIAKSAQRLRMAFGLAWEDWVVRLFPDMVHQPGEGKRGGIICTPDGFTHNSPLAAGGTLIEEFKTTVKSSYNREKGYSRDGEGILKEKLYMWQLAGECWIFGLRYCRLHVLWLCGDYRPPSPRYVQYVIKFNDEEIKQHGRMLKANKAGARPEGHHV